MSKSQKKTAPGKKKLGSEAKVYILEALVVVAVLIVGLLVMFSATRSPDTSDREPTKLDLLAKAAVTQSTLDYIKTNPAGEKAKCKKNTCAS